MENINYSYALTDEDVCLEVDNTTLVTREDSSRGSYIVCSRAHLNAVSSNLTDNYALYQDINLGTAAEGGDGEGNFTPIASSFTGTFDGRGKEIMNLTISVNGNAGLFLKLGAGGTIQNLGIENLKVATTSILVNATDPTLVGTLAALMTGGLIVDCYAVDTDEDADVSGFTGTDNVGGLVGRQDGGLIISSYAVVAVDGKESIDGVGGLVGLQYQNGSSIVSSYAAGDVNGGEGSDAVGGLVGRQWTAGSIVSSYAAGDVNGGKGVDNIGGLVGIQQDGTSIIFSYAVGNVNDGGETADRVGGLVGFQTNGDLIVSSYAAGDVNGGKGADEAGGLTGDQIDSVAIASYGFGTVTDETNTLGAPPTGVTANALTASAAGSSQWGGTNSPWKFGTTSQPPALAFITGASVSDDKTTVTYACTDSPDTAFLPAITINCGTTLLPGQSR